MNWIGIFFLQLMISILIINCRKKIPIQFIIFIFQVGEVGSLGLQEMIYGVKKKKHKSKNCD